MRSRSHERRSCSCLADADSERGNLESALAFGPISMTTRKTVSNKIHHRPFCVGVRQAVFYLQYSPRRRVGILTLSIMDEIRNKGKKEQTFLPSPYACQEPYTMADSFHLAHH